MQTKHTLYHGVYMRHPRLSRDVSLVNPPVFCAQWRAVSWHVVAATMHVLEPAGFYS